MTTTSSGVHFVLPSPLRRVMYRICLSNPFIRATPVISTLVPRIDKALSRLTRGKATLTGILLPTLVLTTTGRKSGRRRTTPVAYVAEADGSLLVFGSNYGLRDHPSWTANLLACPEAEVTCRGRTSQMAARVLTGPEREDVWASLLHIWPPLEPIQASMERRVRVFRLSAPASCPAADSH